MSRVLTLKYVKGPDRFWDRAINEPSSDALELGSFKISFAQSWAACVIKVFEFGSFTKQASVDELGLYRWAKLQLIQTQLL